MEWSTEYCIDNKQGSVYKNKINFQVETQVTVEYILVLQEQEMNYC